jgi:hypothetical protein
MTALINVDNLRFYLGQADGTDSEYIFDADFDTYKYECGENVLSWSLNKTAEGHDTLNMRLGSAENFFKDTTYGRPIDFNYGVEIKYITGSSTFEVADTTTNWGRLGARFSTASQNLYDNVQGTACIEYTVSGGDVQNGVDQVVVTGLSTSVNDEHETEMWIWSSRAVAVGKITLEYFKTVVGYVSVDTATNVNALRANEWTRVRFTALDYGGPAATITKVEVNPTDNGIWTTGDTLKFDRFHNISEWKTVWKGVLNPVDFESGLSRTEIDVNATGISKWASDLLISRDYVAKDWEYVEDIIWDIIYNLTCLNSGFGIDLYVPVSGTDTTMTARRSSAVPATAKHHTARDFSFRNISASEAITQLCGAARIGWYWGADADDGSLRLTLKSRAVDTADYTIDADSYQVGGATRKKYNDNVVSKVVVTGKDGVTAMQLNREAINQGYMKTKEINASSLETIHECAERAHYEILKAAPEDEIVEVSCNVNNTTIGHNFLFMLPYEVVDITDAELNLTNDYMNIMQVALSSDTTVQAKLTLGENYRRVFLKYYDLISDAAGDSDKDAVPTHYRSVSASISLDYDYYSYADRVTCGGDVTITEAGKRELGRCFSQAFYKTQNTAQRLMYAYMADSGGNLLTEDTGTATTYGVLDDSVFFTIDDTNYLVRLYLPFEWTNNMGANKTVDYMYPTIIEYTDLTTTAEYNSTTVKVANAENAAADKIFTIEYRNSARVIWSDSVSGLFAIDVNDYEMFQDDDVLTVQQPDGTTTTVTVDVYAADHVLEKTAGTLPVLGATVYLEGTETCYVSSVSFGTAEDTITTTSALSRTIMAGTKVAKAFTYAFENADDISDLAGSAVDIADGDSATFYLVITLTADQTATLFNDATITKEGLMFLANQLVGDTNSGSYFRRVYKSQDFYGAIGDDNSTALSHAWMDNYSVALQIASGTTWTASAFEIETGAGSVSSLSANNIKREFIANTADLDGDGTNEANDWWNNYELVFSSGDNDGERRRITDWVSGTKTITLEADLPHFPTSGDTFYIEAPVKAGDVIFCETTGGNPERITGVSDENEQRAAFLRVVSYTGGPPKNTIQLEDNHSLGADPDSTYTITLLCSESLASEISRKPANVTNVVPGFDGDKYAIKFVTEFDSQRVGEETSGGLFTGNYNEVQEVGIFTQAGDSESALQYYLNDVRYDGESVGLGYGDDPYDNMTQRGLKEHDSVKPRSDYLMGATNVLSVEGYRANASFPPTTITTGMFGDDLITWRNNPFDKIVSVTPGSTLQGLSDTLPTTQPEESYIITYGAPGKSKKVFWAGFWPTKWERSTWVDRTIPAAWAAGSSYYTYVGQIFSFVLPADINPRNMGAIRFHWGGVSNKPITAYIKVNPDEYHHGQENHWVNRWEEVALKSPAGVDSSLLSASASGGEKYFFGSLNYNTDTWRAINENRTINILLIAGENPATTTEPYLYSDYAYIEFASSQGFQTERQIFRKGIDYYYDSSDPTKIEWDYFDPIEYTGTITAVKNMLSGSSEIVLTVDNIARFRVGDQIYIETATNGALNATTVTQIMGSWFVIAASNIVYSDLAVGDKIYRVIENTNKEVTIAGRNYTKELPTKTLQLDTFDDIRGMDAVLAYEAFENGEDGETITTTLTTLHSVGGDPLFNTTHGISGWDSVAECDTTADYVQLYADTSDETYAVFATDVYLEGSIAPWSAGCSIILLDAAGPSTTAGVKFLDDGTMKVQIWDGGWTDTKFDWQYDKKLNVRFVVDMTNNTYQVIVNGHAIFAEVEDNATIDLSQGDPVYLRVAKEASLASIFCDEMYIGSGTVSSFETPPETQASFAEASFRKYGYMAYAPSELKIATPDVSEDVSFNSLKNYAIESIIHGAVLESITDGEIFLSKVDDAILPNGDAVVLNTWDDAGGGGPTIPDFDIDVTTETTYTASLRLKCDASTMQIEHESGTVGGTYYSGSYDDRSGASYLEYPKVLRFCHFPIWHEGAAAVNSVVELWSSSGDGDYDYLSAYNVQEGAGTLVHTMIDHTSGVVGSQSGIGCVNFYSQELAPGAGEKMADTWSSGASALLYDNLVGDDYLILNEDFQPAAGIPRWQPGMQISIAGSANPDPRAAACQGGVGDVEHFIVRKVEPFPRHSKETWETVGAGNYADDEHIVSDWGWQVTEDGGTASVTTTTAGFARGVCALLATTTATHEAAITHTTYIADRQTIRMHLLNGHTGLLDGYIALDNDAGNDCVFLDIDNGVVKHGANTVATLTDSNTWVQLDIEIDYGNGGMFHTYAKDMSTGTVTRYPSTAGEGAAFANAGPIRSLTISNLNEDGAVRNLYVGDCEIFGGDRSTTYMYVHLYNNEDGNAEYSRLGDIYIAPDVYVFKWMNDRAAICLIWVNPYRGLESRDSASLSMFYRRGANYIVRYATGQGICLLRGLLLDTSSDSPLSPYPKEKIIVNAELEVVF